MKILQVNKFYYLRGGSEKYVFDLSGALKKLGHEVVDFSMHDDRNWPSRYSKYFVDNVSFDSFSVKAILKFVYNWQAVRQLKKLLKDEKPDIAHLHNIAHQLTPAIIKTLKSAGVPVVQTLHDYKLVCPNYRLFVKNKQCERCFGGKYYNCAVNNCMNNSRSKSILAMIEAYWNNSIKKYYDLIDLFIAPSNFMAETVIRSGVSRNRVKTIYNFTDLKIIEKDIDGESLLYFGRLSAEKGIETLLDAMTELSDQKLVIAGVGPSYAELKKRIVDLGLMDRVSMVGHKQGDELALLVDNARAIIVPSLWPENMPLSVIEAMRRQKIVIASRVGGLTELIEDGKTGFLFEAGNVKQLSGAIKQLKIIKRQVIGQFASEKVVDLTSDKHVQQIIGVYSDVILANNKQK